MSSADASIVIEGKSIEELKVVELRKELEQRNLPKSGNKKELYERLRNYLLNSGEVDRLKSTSSSPQLFQKEADAPVEQATINPYVKQYLANQQQALAEAKLNAERVRGTPSSDDDDVETTGDSPAKEPGGGQNPCSPISITHPPTEPLPPSATSPEKEKEKESQQQQPTPPAICGVEKPPEEPKDSAQTKGTLFADSKNQGANKVGKKTKEGTSPDEAAEKVIEAGETMPVIDSAEVAPEEPTSTMIAGEDLDYGEGLDDESPAAEEEVSKDTIVEKVTDDRKQTRTEGMETVMESTKEGDARRSITRPRFEKAQLPASLPSDDNNITPEGFVRRRDSYPARNPPSQYIAIRGLKRPFTQKQLISMLSTFGTLKEDEFWIDSIKSSCIAKFDNEEQAKRARESLHNVVWPPASDSDEEKLARRRAETDKKPVPSSLGPQPTAFGGVAMPPVGGGLGITITVDNRTSLPSREVGIHYHDSIAMRDGVIQAMAMDDASEERLPEPTVLERKRQVSAQSGDSTQRSTPIIQRSLEELFLKTETKPHIYYLPLTMEQAEERAEKKREAAALAPPLSPPAPGPSRQQQDSVERERDRERRDRYRGDRSDGYRRNSGGGMRRSRSPVGRARYRGADDSPPRRRR